MGVNVEVSRDLCGLLLILFSTLDLGGKFVDSLYLDTIKNNNKQ